MANRAVLVALNHYLWFQHFSSLNKDPYGRRGSHAAQPSFTEIASYFGLSVWLVPFALFVSLSASENVLPTMSQDGTTVEGRREGMAKVAVEQLREFIASIGTGLGLGTRNSSGLRDSGRF